MPRAAVVAVGAGTAVSPPFPAADPQAAIPVHAVSAGGWPALQEALPAEGRRYALASGFKAQPVLAGRRAGDRIEILGGLTGNERIVGANAFLLKAELAKGEAEHGH